MNKQNSNIVVGAIFIAGLGYLAGVLTAPKSGRETRQDIKDAAAKAKNEASKRLRRLNEDAADLIAAANVKIKSLSGSAKEELKDAIAKAQKARDKSLEVLGALKAGEANDEDLQNAMDEVSRAITHLREYSKKPVTK